jgi:hypothetical protein
MKRKNEQQQQPSTTNALKSMPATVGVGKSGRCK